VEASAIAPGKDGVITLSALEAIIHGETAQYETGKNRDNIGFWTDPDDYVEWTFRAHGEATFQVEALVATTAASNLKVTIVGHGATLTTTFPCPETGDYGKFATAKGAILGVPAAGIYSLTVKPVKDGWQPVNLKSIRLVPTK
jgi:hypothetical protein